MSNFIDVILLHLNESKHSVQIILEIKINYSNTLAPFFLYSGIIIYLHKKVKYMK